MAFYAASLLTVIILAGILAVVLIAILAGIAAGIILAGITAGIILAGIAAGIILAAVLAGRILAAAILTVIILVAVVIHGSYLLKTHCICYRSSMGDFLKNYTRIFLFCNAKAAVYCSAKPARRRNPKAYLIRTYSRCAAARGNSIPKS